MPMKYDLLAETYKVRQAERARKQLPPLPPLTELPPLEPIGSHPPPPSSSPTPAPLRFPEQDQWAQVMTDLLPLAHVYQWAAQWQPEAWLPLGAMEDQCKLAAENNHPKEYQRLKDIYLRMVGQVVQDYFQKVMRYQYLEFVSLSLLKTVRVCTFTTEPIEEGRTYFYAREIPRILCATPAEIDEFVAIKDAMPGALIV